MNAVLQSLSHLSTEEKLQLVEDLWDDIADDKKRPTSEVARAEVLRRATWRDSHPGPGKSLGQMCIHHSRDPLRWPGA